jgi:hypothetical protein
MYEMLAAARRLKYDLPDGSKKNGNGIEVDSVRVV